MNPSLSPVSLKSLIAIAEAQRAMLIILTSVSVPEVAKTYHEAAISLIATTLEDVNNRYKLIANSELDVSHVDEAFTRKESNNEV